VSKLSDVVDDDDDDDDDDEIQVCLSVGLSVGL